MVGDDLAGVFFGRPVVTEPGAAIGGVEDPFRVVEHEVVSGDPVSEAEVFSAPARHDEPRFVRRDDGLGTVTQPELAQHAADVGLHGLFRDHEAVRNLDV